MKVCIPRSFQLELWWEHGSRRLVDKTMVSEPKRPHRMYWRLTWVCTVCLARPNVPAIPSSN